MNNIESRLRRLEETVGINEEDLDLQKESFKLFNKYGFDNYFEYYWSHSDLVITANSIAMREEGRRYWWSLNTNTGLVKFSEAEDSRFKIKGKSIKKFGTGKVDLKKLLEFFKFMKQQITLMDILRYS